MTNKKAKPLYSKEEYEVLTKLPYECLQCGKTFYVLKAEIKYDAKKGRVRGRYCSMECVNKALVNKKLYSCTNCGKAVYKTPSEFRRSKSGRVFCSKSCAVTYNNTHKKYGTRRSKLEIFIEQRLKDLYPTLQVLYNDKTAIDSELDIYIPALKLAFEINGIFHYKPIYGQEKLERTQANDQLKLHRTYQKDIALVSIDVSKFGHFKESEAILYVNYIQEMIEEQIRINTTLLF